MNDLLIKELVNLFFRLREGDLDAQKLIDNHALIPGRKALIDICQNAVFAQSQSRNHAQASSGYLTIKAPCSCDGNNTNCYKCSGFGFYDKTIVNDPMRRVTNEALQGKFSQGMLNGFASDSRGGAYSIRDHGRFDSSPVEDDYGEES